MHRDVFIADPGQQRRHSGPTASRGPREITNIYAILRGTDPAQASRMVLVTGHYDSRNTNILDARGAAPGANDDASGVAVSLECARALSKLHFPATIVFVAVAGEEQGLVGSAHLAKLAHDQGWQLEAVLNNDIVGGNTTPGDSAAAQRPRAGVLRGRSRGCDTRGSSAAFCALGQGERLAQPRACPRRRRHGPHLFSRDWHRRFSAFLVDAPDRYLRGGDHSSFNHEGFAAVRFTEWREDYNHQHQNVVLPPAGSNATVMGDLPQFVDFNYVARVARLNAATLATLASAPGEPQHVTIETQTLKNGTTLRWEAPDGAPDGILYQVVWRETTAPDWQYTIPPVQAIGATGSSVVLTLPISKDNVIFGVRSIDAAGHRSLVVVP